MKRTRKSEGTRGGAVAVLVVVSLWGGGCYDPKILPGGLVCAPSGKRCPDGFTCAPSGRCERGDGAGGAGLSGGTGGAAGTGGAGGTCANPIVPLCSGTVGTACDPVCQTGCGCGLRCSVTSSGTSCASPLGTKGLGAICQPGSDDCAPGYVCLKEVCGTNLGRCFQFCRAGTPCGAGVGCNTAVTLDTGTTSQLVCNLGDSNCNIYDGTGCPDPALKCYVAGTRAKCDCPSTSGAPLNVGDTCVNYNDCGTGLVCLTVSGATQSQCFRLCQTAADCGGATCMSLGSVGGYCP